MVSENVQEQLSVHLLDVRALLAIDDLAEVTIGLIANMVYAETSMVEFRDLLQNSFHERMAAQLANGIIAVDHPLFDTALELLEALSEEDVEFGEPNKASTQMTMEHITSAILTKNDFEQDAFETMVRTLLRWASKRDLRLDSRDLAKIYETVIQKEVDVEGTTEEGEKSLVQPFESILGELASERAVDSADEVEDLTEPAANWVRYSTTQPNTRQNRLCATGFLILCNVCDDNFAVKAVSEQRLHEAAIAVLRDPAKRRFKEVRTNAAAFLANLCQPKQNRETIMDTKIVSELFYDVPDVEPELSIKIMRRLVSSGFGAAAEAAMQDERSSLPNFKHVIELLPDQKALQHRIGKQDLQGESMGMQAPSRPGEQLTKDIAHIFVNLRRHSDAVSTLVTPKLVRALVNLVLLGVKARNAFDTSEGVFGLGLVLQGNHKNTDLLAIEMIEAITRYHGTAAFSQIVEARKADTSDVAQKVTENATSVFVRLVEVAERQDLAMDVLTKLKDVLSAGLVGREVAD